MHVLGHLACAVDDNGPAAVRRRVVVRSPGVAPEDRAIYRQAASVAHQVASFCQLRARIGKLGLVFEVMLEAADVRVLALVVGVPARTGVRVTQSLAAVLCQAFLQQPPA